MNYEEMQTETVEAAESADVTTEVDLSAFDEGWDDDGYPAEVEDAEQTTEEADSDEAEADQQEAETADASEATEETEQTEEQKDETADQRFTLKHLDEVKEVGRDEVIALAQKGLDYDRKTQKLTNKIAEYEEFLKELADPNNLTIEQLMDSTRARIYMANAEREGREVSESDAIFAVQKARVDKAEAETSKAAEAESKAQETRKEAIKRFVEVYPNMKAEDIPQSVWDEAGRTGDLLGAYTRHENAELKKKIRAMETNRKNEQRSIGSKKTAGSGKAKDPFDEGWDSI